MGPDEQSSSKYGMIMMPINEDGTYGEPIKIGNCKPLFEEDLYTPDLTEKKKPLLITSWTGEFNVRFKHKKISKKTFKKWLISNRFDRNLAERFCQIIGSFGGRISYQSIYIQNVLIPTPNAVLNAILFEGERTHEQRSKTC